ncbi:DUF72 domain-containing protein [Chloroflexi bacterium TSY]|nr:DUF72 domain-containing protein [Chloroflexi bacterium TSY]
MKNLYPTFAATVFLDAIRSLGQAAAPALLQFPPDFTRATNGRDLALYLDWLAVEAKDVSLGVEVRSNDLMTPAFARYLAERQITLVMVDRAGTPDLFELWQAVIEEGIGPKHLFVRWIGNDRDGPTGNRELTEPRDADLDRWANRLHLCWEAGVSLYGYMHNPYEGHSPESIRRLLTRLDDMIQIPDWPPEDWVAVQSGNEDKSFGQLSLFD